MILLKEAEIVKIRSGVKYIEEGEKCTAYFYACSKQRASQANIEKLRTEDGVITEQKVIDVKVAQYYKDLYTKVQTESSRDWFEHVPVLSNEDRDWMNRPMTNGEYKKVVLKEMATGKAPGNDGLGVAVYRSTWSDIGPFVCEALNEALEEGELAPSQKQSVIRLLQKKGKDHLELKNWRPISLMNTDAKILAKALAARLQKVLPSLIADEQHAFLSGRQIHDGTRMVQQAIDHFETTGQKGAIISFLLTSRRRLTALTWIFCGARCAMWEWMANFLT